MKLADPVEQVCRGSLLCGRLRCVYEIQCKFALDTITLCLDVVLLIYDAFITFDREVACFWTAKRTGGSLLFFANKWISVSAHVMDLVELAAMTLDFPSCSSFLVVGYALLILQFVPGAVFSALRAYVFSRSKFLGMLVLALSLAPAGANLVLYGYQFSGENFPPFGCLRTGDLTVGHRPYALTHTDPQNCTVVILSRAPLIVADILLIYITWTKLRSCAALTDIRQSKRLSLSDILFRGGIILFILNVLHLGLSLTALAGTSNSGASVVTVFTAPITSILISRFLLELQEANQTDVRLDPGDPLHSSRHIYDSTPSFISSLEGFINPELEVGFDDDSFELQVRSLAEAPGEEEDGGLTESPQAAASSSSA
ncbi:hypothetical protein K466DRAFT_475515 [Polyporus arcularius HHB13444]|uniref:DUF6533 domain-containing protein n=1 Tax=Polyporus arcularius HHB13444 TaxID=1314778 RepID=A0A5C3Q369_9APHY|nr:hypothetical protein K466DRAFT_475515 [Polyporus arcularius HHB13444]